MQFFVTATDTDAGKTYVTCLLLESLKARGESAVGYKPYCCGGRQDAVALHAASAPDYSLEEINPIWLKTPASPYAASLIENRSVELDKVRQGFRDLAARSQHLLVEGVGGWEVPVSEGYSMGDLAQELGLPVLLVVNNRLGALNHTLLTLRAILARGLTCRGIVLNYAQAERDAASISNAVILERMTDIPVLGEVMHGETDDALLQAILDSEP